MGQWRGREGGGREGGGCDGGGGCDDGSGSGVAAAPASSRLAAAWKELVFGLGEGVFGLACRCSSVFRFAI